MAEVSSDLDLVQKVLNATNTIATTINSDLNINNLIDAANTVVNGEFVLHMSDKAIAEPKRFSHMYEWNAIGDPNAKLWRSILSGRGKSRQTSYTFVASKTSVPVAPALKAVGVKSNHIFYWKAMVLELGLPVNISPILAKVLVFEAKETKGGGSSSTLHSWLKDGIVYHNGTINIGRAGNTEMWGAFNEAYAEWYGSDAPAKKIDDTIGKMSTKTIKNTFIAKINQIQEGKRKNKAIVIQPMGLDAGYQSTLQSALNNDYTAAAATRRVLADE